MRILALVVVATAVIAADPCLVRLADDLFPLCTDVCSSACCAALTVREDGCSSAWIDEWRLFAQRVRVARAAAGCAYCGSRRACLYPPGDASPCNATACEALHQNGTMTRSCAATVNAFCAASDAPCVPATRCTSSDDWFDCAVLPRASLVETAVAQFAAIPRTLPRAFISLEGFAWVQHHGCTALPALARHACPCTIARPVDDAIEVVACVLTAPSLLPGPPDVSFAAMFVSLSVPVLAFAFHWLP